MKCGKVFTTTKLAGYTIIEILVALSIAGIIFVGGFASFRDFSRRQLLTSAQRTLKGDLRLTQGYALIGKKPEDAKCQDPNVLDAYGIFFNNATEYIVRANCSGGSVDIKTISLPQDLEISIPNPNPIAFKVLGQGTNLSGAVTLTLSQVSTGNLATVIVTPGGEIK